MTRAYFAGLLALVLLVGVSLVVGVIDIFALFRLGERLDQASLVLLMSRVPRTLALILAGSALGVTGLLMQLLTRNRFVEPSTAGSGESAMLGLLVAMAFVPESSLFSKMLIATFFASAGTLFFFSLIERVSVRTILVVPLIGIMLGRVIDSVTTFFAYRLDLLQSLNAWSTGDFSHILAGRYELLWVAAALTLVGYLAADRFTVAGLGEEFTTNLGLPYRRLIFLGLVIVSAITATTVVTVGTLPLFGLAVPNLVSMYFGDNARRTIPWVALLGAIVLLICDLLARTIRAPYELPVGTIVGVLGAGVFLALLLRRRSAHG